MIDPWFGLHFSLLDGPDLMNEMKQCFVEGIHRRFTLVRSGMQVNVMEKFFLFLFYSTTGLGLGFFRF